MWNRDGERLTFGTKKDQVDVAALYFVLSVTGNIEQNRLLRVRNSQLTKEKKKMKSAKVLNSAAENIPLVD